MRIREMLICSLVSSAITIGAISMLGAAPPTTLEQLRATLNPTEELNVRRIHIRGENGTAMIGDKGGQFGVFINGGALMTGEHAAIDIYVEEDGENRAIGSGMLMMRHSQGEFASAVIVGATADSASVLAVPRRDGSQPSEWYSVKQGVYHTRGECPDGNNIEAENLRFGTGGHPSCKRCLSISTGSP